MTENQVTQLENIFHFKKRCKSFVNFDEIENRKDLKLIKDY